MMLKLFISLFLMVLLSFVIFLGFGIVVDTVGSSLGANADIEERVTRGTLDLLDESIEGLNTEQRDELMKKYQGVFGPAFALVKMSQIKFNAKQQEGIENKEIVIVDEMVNLDLTPADKNSANKDEDSINLIFRKHLDTSLVWRIHLDAEPDVSIDNFKSVTTVDGGRFMDGMFYVLEQKFQPIENIDLNNVIEALEPSFGLLLKLLDKKNLDQLLDGKPEIQSLFKQNQVINISQGSNQATFIRSFRSNEQGLQIGPIEIPWIIRNFLLVILLTFVLAIATALFIWLWPLWSNLLKIKHAANEFGEGNYSARIPYRKRSAIAPVAHAFNAMAERTQHSINTQKELTTAVSHELRTPVSRMRFALEMLEESENKEDKARYVESINADIDDLDLLLEELLSYARFDQENTQLELRLEKLPPWLSTSMDKLMPLAEKKYLNYQIEGIGMNESAYFEPRLLSRVLDNLVQNALRYAKSTVEVTLQKDVQHYVLTVEDDGNGISKADQTHIFDAFSRIDSSRDRSTGGFGLGLAIADRIIKAHLGSITIKESRLGGACFEVRWPIAKADSFNIQ